MFPIFGLPKHTTAVVATFLLAGVAVAQVRTSARPVARVTERIDNTSTVSLAGTHPAVVERAAMGTRLQSSTPMTHMRLVLTSTDDQILALRSLMDEQQDNTSPNYHAWLTPDTFGQYFGVAPSDVAQVSAWLQDQGFTIESVAKGNRIVSFAGTVGQVEKAFHTQMNHITVDGESHISNVTDISVPQALSTVIKGVASLNDFFPRANVVDPHKAQIATKIPYITPGAEPDYTSTSSGAHYVTPGDAATIYNSTPLLNSGIDGTGITIAVLGRSNITLSDVQQFRSMFGLKKNDPTFTVLANNPGLNGDDIEAYLDVEWSGGMAPGANVNFILGGPDYFNSGGIDTAGYYAVDNNIGDIITLSYGGCETGNGASGTAFWNTLWEQAAAQGQSVFVSSGDSSAAGCQSSSATYGTAYGVNALGSSAYNVAVGGTMFVDYGPSQYWGAGVAAPAPAGYNFATATSYIPEAPWNQGALTTTYLNTLSTAPVTGSGIAGGGGGISIYTARPPWQTGSGISSTSDPGGVSGTGIAGGSPIMGLHRLVPDISFIAASGHDATAFCAEGTCSDTSAGYGIGAVGGTSVATPVMASVQALIDQRNGGRQGNPNYFYYPLANADYLAGNCKSVNGTAASPTVTLPAFSCNFHDVVAGSNVVKQSAADTVGLGFNAATGFDPASGLGSVNISNVATNWSTVSFRATKTIFTLSPTIAAHTASQLFSATVTASSGTGTPSGDISIIAVTNTPSQMQQYTLSGGFYSGSISGLPAGSYNVYVHYAGDGTFAPSNSASIPVTIGQQGSVVTDTLSYISGNSIYSPVTSLPYGTVLLIYTSVTPNPAGSTTIPTGKLTYSVTFNGASLPNLVETLDGYGDASLQSGASSIPLYLNATYPVLAPGAYVVTASYSGDTTYTASSTTTSFTVTQMVPTVSLTTSSTYITSGSAVTLNYSVTRPSGTYVTPLTAYPTGTVIFTDTTTGATLGNASLSVTGLAKLTTSAITTSGAHTISAVYQGDANYTSTSSTTLVTVGTLTATTTALSVTPSTYYVGSTVPLTATVSPAVSAKVSFYDGSILLGTATSSATTGIATLSTTALTAGSHTLAAAFTGTTTYAASTGTLGLTISQSITTLNISAPTTSIYGQPISMNGRISRNPSIATPAVGLTGTVTFYDSGTVIATATPVYLPGGYLYYTATTTLTTLAAGTHTLSAIYNGDANYAAAATSGTVTTNIAPYTPSITLSSTATVYNGTNAVPLTATIPLSSALVGPTGQVIFYDGSTMVGSVTAVYSAAAGGYVASTTLMGVSGGSHIYTAVLAGDGNYNSATSAPLTVLINMNNIWIANGNGSVSGLTQSGTPVTSSPLSSGGTGVAIDNSGYIWSLNKSGNSAAKFSSTGIVLSSGYAVGGINAPAALAIDGAGIVWIANGNGTVSGVTPAGTAVSNTAYITGLSTPTSINVDASGNLWITNAGDNSVTEVVGAATPVTTPTTTAVKTNSLAVKP